MATRIRNLRAANAEKSLYLTFDDGPEASSTPQVLDCLAEFKIQATFFMVAEKAAKERNLVKRIIEGGHAIGNHSLDHTYHRLFRGKRVLKNWLLDSEALLQEMSGKPTVGFRPPNGILTPELAKACEELDYPLIYWNVRFFDTLVAWNKKSALRSLEHTDAGSIVLLHDRQPAKKLPLFLETLSAYSKSGIEKGFVFSPLKRDLVRCRSPKP